MSASIRISQSGEHDNPLAVIWAENQTIDDKPTREKVILTMTNQQPAF